MWFVLQIRKKSASASSNKFNGGYPPHIELGYAPCAAKIALLAHSQMPKLVSDAAERGAAPSAERRRWLPRLSEVRARVKFNGGWDPPPLNWVVPHARRRLHFCRVARCPNWSLTPRNWAQRRPLSVDGGWRMSARLRQFCGARESPLPLIT